jgi:pyruvate/2-oxoglutarate dehydrogenase complex dihydrolipoamide acyltransferase (E2) component
VDEAPVPAGTVVAPTRATVVAVKVQVDEIVAAGQELLVLEAMKMQQAVVAPTAGTVEAVLADRPGRGARRPAADASPRGRRRGRARDPEEEADPDHVRPDLAALHEALAPTLDEHRPDAVARRHDRGRRTARENLADLVDDGSFLEYGQLAVAGQRRAAASTTW